MVIFNSYVKLPEGNSKHGLWNYTKSLKCPVPTVSPENRWLSQSYWSCPTSFGYVTSIYGSQIYHFHLFLDLLGDHIATPKKDRKGKLHSNSEECLLFTFFGTFYKTKLCLKNNSDPQQKFLRTWTCSEYLQPQKRHGQFKSTWG